MKIEKIIAPELVAAVSNGGVNTVSNLSGLIKSIDACSDIVNEFAAPFAE